MMEGKKTLGRRKIRMEKIEKKANLQVAFSKRRMGLFKKAAEMSVVCGAEIAILVQSPAGKMFTFGSSSVESILRRLETGVVATNWNGYWVADADARARENYERSQYREALEKLEREKQKEKKELKEIGKGRRRLRELWWEKEIEGIVQVEELEQLAEAMEVLIREVALHIDQRKKSPDGDDHEHQIHGNIPNGNSSSGAGADCTINDYPADDGDDDEFSTLLRHLEKEEESQPHNNNSNFNWELENADALFDFASFQGPPI